MTVVGPSSKVGHSQQQQQQQHTHNNTISNEPTNEPTMLRPPRNGNNGGLFRPAISRKASGSLYSPKQPGGKLPLSAVIFKNMYTILIILVAFSVGMIVQNFFHTVGISNSNAIIDATPLLRPPEPGTTAVTKGATTNANFPPELHRLLDRARLHQQHCQALDLTDATDHSKLAENNHTAHLPQFGILKAAAAYQDNNHDNDYPYTCQLPPEMECSETQFTAIFMAYNPDRLTKLYNQILKMTTTAEFKPLVHQVLIVWNGDRDIEGTKIGKALVDLTRGNTVRISYPLKAGFPNDLMNRYHPRLDIATKAIMYYDDDGPFYSFEATLAGFELWKRNSNAQIGAMARKLDLGERQLQEKSAVLNGPGDRFFVSHCPTDSVRYNYNEFAQFGANMVLPSGSFLHSYYLCWLWHPIFAEIRQYVKDHPVNPDDGTVSIIVSQLSGRAPKVYPRRINTQKNRRLLDMARTTNETNTKGRIGENEQLLLEDTDSDTDSTVPRRRRRLMDGIDWDNTKQAADKKNKWGKLRSDAANSLARYFGSMNSGSIGWCYGTPYEIGGKCKPEMATVGQLPWMKADHTPRDVCP